MPLCKTKVLLKISEHKMLSFSLRNIENDNSLVDISFSKIGENEFSSDFIANLEMLKLQENGRNDQYIFFSRRDIPKLTCLTAKFQEYPVDLLRETAWRSNFCLVLFKSFSS